MPKTICLSSSNITFSRDSVPDLTGETTVITGANGGLGLQTARVFASKGARVVMAVHDQVKAARAVEEIRAETPEAGVELVELDSAYYKLLAGFEERRR